MTEPEQDVAPARVAVLHLGRNGGGPKFTFEIARCLEEAGASVFSVISSSADNRRDFERLGSTLALRTFTSGRQAVVRVPTTALLAVQVVRYLRQNDVPVVLVGMEQIWQAPILAAVRLSGRRVLLCVHDGTMHPGEANLLERALRALQRRLATGFVVFSDHVAEVVSRSAGRRPVQRTVHGVFGSVRSDPRSAPGPVPVVGFFGRLAEYKGLALGYAAVQELRAQGRQVVFRVVGSGSDPALAAMTHADDDLRIGWTSDDEVPSILEEMDVLLLPYREASQSGVLAYAMARALPAVTTPVGGLVEQARASGAAIVASGIGVEPLRSALADLLDDPHRYASVSAAGLRAAHDSYSWARVARDLLAAVRATRTPRSRRPARLEPIGG
jgi:glycosyltransferase involved in cell wall biosynthesis